LTNGMSRLTNKSKASGLFTRADQQHDLGNLRPAFRLMLAAARLGDVGAQLNVGYYYDEGKGIRRNRAAALYWYLRAYRRGDYCAAHNIGVLWRNEGDLKRALYWFSRAVRMGDEESNIDIGKHFLQNEKNPRRAIAYFKRVKPSGWVSEAGVEEAAKLLRLANRRLEARHRS
jgi:uncharacterized protein